MPVSRPLSAGLAAGLAAVARVATACGRGESRDSRVPPPPPTTASPGAIVPASGAPAAGGAAGAQPLENPTNDTLYAAADRGRIQGDSTATVWVVMISDFQCPFCKEWHDQVYPQVKREYVDTRRVRLAYVNYPVRGHQNAWPAALATMCASAQGRFWQMHDAVFATQARWSPMSAPQQLFDSLAIASGVRDQAAWRSCVQRESLRPLIQADYERSVRSGIRATPTFIIGQSVVEGAVGFADIKVRLDSALAGTGGPRR